MAYRFDTKNVEPEDLAGLSEEQFRAVVDADLRRRVSPDGLLSETAQALREPENVERWFATLDGIRLSVEGQLTATADEYDALRSDLEATIKRLEADGGSAARLQRLYDEENTMRVDYLAKKAARERFLTGLKEHLARAESLRNEHRATRSDSLVAAERDRLRRRVERLERAIEGHRKAVLADLSEDEEPERYEESLWAVLAATGG
jgi:hypothetical protein